MLHASVKAFIVYYFTLLPATPHASEGSGLCGPAGCTKTRGHGGNGVRGDPQTCRGMGLRLQVSARSEAAAVPPGGRRWLQELHLFIIAIYIVPGICRRLQQPRALIRPRHALGAGACPEVGGTACPGIPSCTHLAAGPGSRSPPPGTRPNQAGPHSLLQQLLDRAAQAHLSPPQELSSNCSINRDNQGGAEGSGGSIPAPGPEMRSRSGLKTPKSQRRRF